MTNSESPQSGDTQTRSICFIHFIHIRKCVLIYQLLALVFEEILHETGIRLVTTFYHLDVISVRLCCVPMSVLMSV